MKNTYKERLKFLGRYFNDHEQSITESLAPYFEEYDVEHWQETTDLLHQFLSESYSLSAKEILIQQYIDLDFDTKRSAPLLWLATVVGTIEHRLIKARAKEAAIEAFSVKYRVLFDFLARFQCSKTYTPEEVLNEYFKETDSEDWVQLAALIRSFLAEDLSKNKKLYWIDRYVDIDFHYRNMPALLWLKGVASSMDYRIQWEQL